MDSQKNEGISKSPARPVAITGYSHRLPGSLRTDDDFWQLIAQRESIRVPIANRYGRGYRPVGKSPGIGRFASPYEGLICDDRELEFDRSLFGISQFELSNMNPQVRMLLSCAWEVIEHAGWDIGKLRNSATGVFIGSQTPAIANWRPIHGPNEFSVINSSLAMLANQVSYHFNLMGSSMTYCTACSAGLSAMYTAFNALAWGHCDRAIVGSVNYLGSARQSSGFTNLGVVSPDGKCNSFDANANGYMRSEGCIAFALKPLADAENDGDHIFAVIESAAVNAAGAADQSEGLTQGRYITAPTRHSQISLISSALALANRDPLEFDYIEAHATGTVVGDRIEGNAICEAFSSPERAVPLRLSSVKSNIGHLEAAAFNASLLKVILMMNRRTFAPISNNFFEPNPEIDFASCPMLVQTGCEPFPDHQVTVGINSFGIGGANGHCVVSEYRPSHPQSWPVPAIPEGAGCMVPVSARTSEALAKSVANLADFLQSHQTDVCTLAGNLARRRTHFAVRTSFSALNTDDLLRQLKQFDAEKDFENLHSRNLTAQNIAMVFAGQGTQWAGCGCKLYESQPVFRRTVDTIEEHWLEHANYSLREACFSASQEQLNEAELAQPAIFMIQCALFDLFRTWGVHPAVVVGHSSGEVAAAYASGALSLPDATRLIFHRGQLQQRTAGSGRMLAVGIDQSGILEILKELQEACDANSERIQRIEIACLNSPASVVVCGPESSLSLVTERLGERNIRHGLLPGNIAFHSSAMDVIREALYQDLAFLNHREFQVKVPFVSSVTGKQTDRLDADYWWSNIRRTVDFQGAIECIKRENGVDVFLEISPHSALQAMIAQCMEDVHPPPPSSIATLMRDADDRIQFNDALGALYRAGAALDFEAQFPRPESVIHLLPGHPKEFQVSVASTMDDEMFVYEGGFSHGPMVGHRVYCDHLRFEVNLSEKTIPYLADHKVQSSAIMPAAGYMELIFEALQGKPAYIEDIEFLQPCPIPDTPIRLQTALYPAGEANREYTFAISSRGYHPEADNELHCRGRVELLDSDRAIDVPRHLSEVDPSGFTPVFDEAEGNFYDRIEATLGNRFQYGPYFQTVFNLKTNPATKDFLFDVEMDQYLWDTGKEEGYVICPPLVDGALQIFLCNLMQATDLFSIPRRAKHITYIKPPSSPRITVHVTKPDDGWCTLDEIGQLTVRCGEKSGGNMRFYDAETGELFLHVQDYIYFTANPNWVKAPNSRHVISWQPKFIEQIDCENDRIGKVQLSPEQLIGALAIDSSGDPRAVHILELAGESEPQNTLLSSCIEPLGKQQLQIEYWLINSTADQSQACYDAFHHHGLSLRFAAYGEDGLAQFERSAGLLRSGSVHMLLLRLDEDASKISDWALLRRLTVAGGLALAIHDEGVTVSPDAGWTVIREESGATLLQASQTLIESDDQDPSAASRLVIGSCDSTVSGWSSQIGAHCIANRYLSTSEAVDYLDRPQSESESADIVFDCFVESDSRDPVGERICVDYTELIQALIDRRADEGSKGRCRINLVTRGAAMEVENPAAAALWGMIRSAATEVGEQAGLDFRLIDIGSSDDLPALAWLMRNDVREREIAIRSGRLWAPRLVHIRDRYPVISDTGASSYSLNLDNPGQVTGLQFKTRDLPQLGDHDVEIEVKYAGLNFRDVMVTLGMLPAQAYERSMLGHEVGMEASGVVLRTGKRVADHRAGDEVLLTQGGCIANRTVVSEHHVFAKPECLSMAEAGSVLSVYVTAYYALFELARLRHGQRVLIHSAMGGVGQAAIQLARHAGAQIYATAGSEGKRRQLLELGVEAAFDSHSFEWHDKLMEHTSGEGVDVVLNSLAGRHVSLCLQALCPGGWHLEIGKVDIYADNSLSLSAFRKNLRFAAIDIDRLMCDDPVLTRRISQDCLDLLSENKASPVPTTIFEFKEFAQALRLMASGQHQGKLVLKAPASECPASRIPVADRRAYFDPDATYLVTGGFGGFGLKLLPYFVVNGARHFTYMDHNPGRRRTAEWIKDRSALTYFGLDVEIDIVPGDVSRMEDVQNCIDGLSRNLKGVFHMAGILDDRLISEMTPDSIAKVFAPKAYGALNLHKATQDLELDHFVLFSSIASLYGNLAQTNYSAASAFLDALASYRHQQGLAALSCNMSGITESGMVARDLHVMRMIRSTGMPPVSLSFVVRNLDYAMRGHLRHAHVLTAIFERPPWTLSSNEYLRSGRSISNQNSFQKSADTHQTLEGVMAQIMNQVAQLCGHSEGSVDDPLSSFGLTSISVAELGAFIQTQFNYQVSALDLMTTSSCRSVAAAILSGNQETQSGSASAESTTEHEAEENAHRLQVRHEPAKSEYESRMPRHSDADPDYAELSAQQSG